MSKNLVISGYYIGSKIKKSNNTLYIQNKKSENIYLTKALNTLNSAYSAERFPMYGLQRDSMSYLLGDLNRRIGNNSEALRWYSSVITTPGVSSRIKDLARDGKNIISEHSSQAI